MINKFLNNFKDKINKKYLIIIISLISLLILSVSFYFIIFVDEEEKEGNSDSEIEKEIENRVEEVTSEDRYEEINEILRKGKIGQAVNVIQLSKNKKIVLVRKNNSREDGRQVGNKVVIVNNEGEIEVLHEGVNLVKIEKFENGEYVILPQGFVNPIFIIYEYTVVKDNKGNEIEINTPAFIYEAKNNGEVSLLTRTNDNFHEAIYRDGKLGIVEKEYQDSEHLYPSYLKPHNLILYFWDTNKKEFVEQERMFKNPLKK